MKFQRTTPFKALTIVLTFAAVMILTQGHALADEVTISGTTTGVVTGVPQLTFTGNTFTNTTFLNIGALSGANNLGTFFLSTAPGQLVAGSFTLNVTFTSPTGIVNGPFTTYTASISGSVSPNVNQGGVNVNFANNGAVVFTFSNAINSGRFSLAVADLFVETGHSANITAGTTGEQAPIPEPATLLLLGTGLTAIAAKLRQRRKNRKGIDA